MFPVAAEAYIDIESVRGGLHSMHLPVYSEFVSLLVRVSQLRYLPFRYVCIILDNNHTNCLLIKDNYFPYCIRYYFIN